MYILCITIVEVYTQLLIIPYHYREFYYTVDVDTGYNFSKTMSLVQSIILLSVATIFFLRLIDYGTYYFFMY